MARSAVEIANSITTTLRGINPSIDLEVGPTYDYLIRPLPREMAQTEQAVSDLQVFYSDKFATVATPEQIAQFATHFGLAPDIGGFAATSVYLYRTSAPPVSSIFTVPVGTLVGTQDLSYIFRVTSEATMYGNFAATYYNPSSNRYEIQVLVQAVGPGTVYNLPSGRLTKLMTNVPGFDGITQRAAAYGGTEPENASQLASRMQAQFLAMDRNSAGGLQRLAQNFNPTQVLATALIRPSDRLEFRRLTDGPAIDLCIKGVVNQIYREDYLAVGGETTIPIVVNRTATSAGQVSQNGTVLAANLWMFVADQSPSVRGSTRAGPVIELLAPLNANDIIAVTGIKNALLDQLQSLYVQGDNSLFNTDILVRGFIDLPIVVTMDIRVSSSPSNGGSVDGIQQVISSLLTNLIEPDTIPTLLIPKTIESLVQALLPDIKSVTLTQFRRQYSSIDRVENIVPLKNEIPRYNATASAITVRT